MLLGLTSKDLVLENAKKIHLLRDKALESYKSFLKLSNPDLQGFLKCVFPQLSSSTVFDYSMFKASLLNGNFGEIFYFQTDPIPLACPLIKQLSDDLDAKIQNINNFKLTEEMQQEKLSNRQLSNTGG